MGNRLAIYAVALGVLALGAWWWKTEAYHDGYRDASEVMARKVAMINEETRVADIKSREAVRAIESEYQNKLGALDVKYRDAVAHLGPVRVCKSASSPPTVPRSDTSPGVPDGAARGDRLPEAPAPDIGADLVSLASDADACATRLAGLQNYVRTVR